MQFISTPAEEREADATTVTRQERFRKHFRKREREADATTVTAPAPKGYRVNPLYIETRSKRLQLLVQPSLLDKLKGKAKAEGRSVNDLVHSILEEALRGE
jgi:hypothetical protein